MARFAIGDRAKFIKSPKHYQGKAYVGKVGIVTEVFDNTTLPDGTKGEMIRISYVDGPIRSVNDMAKHAIKID